MLSQVMGGSLAWIKKPRPHIWDFFLFNFGFKSRQHVIIVIGNCYLLGSYLYSSHHY